jgi:hypothetical protein
MGLPELLGLPGTRRGGEGYRVSTPGPYSRDIRRGGQGYPRLQAWVVPEPGGRLALCGACG